MNTEEQGQYDSLVAELEAVYVRLNAAEARWWKDGSGLTAAYTQAQSTADTRRARAIELEINQLIRQGDKR